MKRITLLGIAVLLLGLVISNEKANGQEEESASFMDAGLDIYSSYIWRGAKFGSGPAFQPWVEAGFGNFAVGAWGSVNASINEAYEMDLYASYSFDFGLSVAVTDYFFGATDTTGVWSPTGFFDYDVNHYIEPMLSYEIADFSFTAAYMFAPGFDDGDMYFEAAYSYMGLDLAIGAGDGAYTDDGEFMICNVSLGTSKDIEITEKFTLPLSGAVVLNPSTEGFYITVGVSF